MSLNPFRLLFVVPDLGWKTKKKELKHTRIQGSSPFSMVGTINFYVWTTICNELPCYKNAHQTLR